MMSEKKVPAIRFRGFEDDWEQRKLGDFGYVAMCKRIFKDQTAESGDIPFYKIGTFGGEPDAYISRDLFKEYKHLYSYPEKGDILISASGSIGRTVEYTGEDAYYQDSNIVWLKHDKTIVNSFLKHLYEVIRWSGIEGSTIKRLYNDNILKTEVMIPAAPEQEEIGKCFNNLDNLITLHQRKLEKLKIVKKSMLVNCFPKNGEKVPKFRFSGFTGDWEQRKVGDITIESTEYTTLDAGYPLLTSSRAGLMYQNEYRGNLTTDSKETLFSVVPIGACTYRHMSDDDVFHLNINTLEKGLVSREYPVFFATKENCLNFIIQYINSSASFRAFCAEQKKGGTRTRLYYNALCEFKMMVPSKREQEVIAGYLLSLDHLITLHQRELKKLQMIKKSMLRSMFV